MWPDLELNEETWEEDMNVHILARRVRYYDGEEAKEREALKKAAKIPRPAAAGQNRDRQLKLNNKGSFDKLQSSMSKISVKWETQRGGANVRRAPARGAVNLQPPLKAWLAEFAGV